MRKRIRRETARFCTSSSLQKLNVSSNTPAFLRLDLAQNHPISHPKPFFTGLLAHMMHEARTEHAPGRPWLRRYDDFDP